MRKWSEILGCALLMLMGVILIGTAVYGIIKFMNG